MNLAKYIQILQTRYQTGIGREHSYRGDLQTLFSELLPGILVTNELARIEYWAPDYIFTKRDVSVGYIKFTNIRCPIVWVKSRFKVGQFRIN